MTRPLTLFTGQWADLPFEEVCKLAGDWGYDGLEIASWGDHFEVDKALEDDGYVESRREILERNGLTSATARCCPPRSGATATRRACASAPPNG